MGISRETSAMNACKNPLPLFWLFVQSISHISQHGLPILELICCYHGAQDLATTAVGTSLDFMDASQASICEDFNQLKYT